MANHDIKQGSKEWLSLRLGKITASRVAAATAKSRTNSSPSISRTKYMEELIYELKSGKPYEKYRSASMDWGNETEPQARIAYARHLSVEVLEIGFVDHPSIPMSGASPDGLVENDGLVEIKCPNSSTHLETIRKGHIPGNYIKQMRWQMACTGRKWCDFVSFDPRVPKKNRLFIKRIHADHEVKKLEKEVLKFVKDLKKSIQDLQTSGKTSKVKRTPLKKSPNKRTIAKVKRPAGKKITTVKPAKGVKTAELETALRVEKSPVFDEEFWKQREVFSKVQNSDSRRFPRISPWFWGIFFLYLLFKLLYFGIKTSVY